MKHTSLNRFDVANWVELEDNSSASRTIDFKPTYQNSNPTLSASALQQNSTIAPFRYNSQNLSGITPIEIKTDAKPLELEVLLASLRPLERWKFLARQKTSTFVVLLLSVVAWLCTLASSWADVKDFSVHFVSVALAQDGETINPTAHAVEYFTKDNVLLLMLSIFVIWSLLTLTFAKASEKIKIASDTMKTLLGFLVGFFSTTKA